MVFDLGELAYDYEVEIFGRLMLFLRRLGIF
jgi:hypothetical protein